VLGATVFVRADPALASKHATRLPTSAHAATFCQLLRLSATALAELEESRPYEACQLFKLLCLVSQASEREYVLGDAAFRAFGVRVRPSPSLEAMLFGGVVGSQCAAPSAIGGGGGRGSDCGHGVRHGASATRDGHGDGSRRAAGGGGGVVGALISPLPTRRAHVPASASSYSSAPRARPILPTALSLDTFQRSLRQPGPKLTSHAEAKARVRAKPMLERLPSGKLAAEGAAAALEGNVALGGAAGLERIGKSLAGRGIVLHLNENESSSEGESEEA